MVEVGLGMKRLVDTGFRQFLITKNRLRVVDDMSSSDQQQADTLPAHGMHSRVTQRLGSTVQVFSEPGSRAKPEARPQQGLGVLYRHTRPLALSAQAPVPPQGAPMI